MPEHRAVRRALVLTAATAALAATVAAAPSSVPRVRSAQEPLAGRYVVVLRDGPAAPAAVADRLTHVHGGTVHAVFDTALRGYAAELTATQAQRVAADPVVASVEQDGIHHTSVGATNTLSSTASWGLDRVDQRTLPLDGTYTAPNNGTDVTVYLVDSGLRTTHTQFGGRARIGVDLVGDGRNGADCLGHGTHVAGTVGGKDTGVAKGVRLVSVRVTPCNDSIPTSSIISAADWITRNAVKPAVVNMSINGGVSSAEDKAIRASIASGVTWVVSSGNGNTDACKNSPGDIAEAVVVNNSTSDDQRRSDSDWGPCTDLFAPGTGIVSAWHTGDTATHTLTGTSMAAPHVTGAAALYLSAHPGATPAQVQEALVRAATADRIGKAGSNTPNRLLYVRPLGDNPTP